MSAGFDLRTAAPLGLQGPHFPFREAYVESIGQSAISPDPAGSSDARAA